MKIIEIKCKSCGAPIKAESFSQIITCPFCKTDLVIDPEDNIYGNAKRKEMYGSSRYTYNGDDYVENM